MFNRIKIFHLFLLFLPIITSGCISDGKTQETTFSVKTSKSTNHGVPFRIVVKETDSIKFLYDDYQNIANEANSQAENPSILSSIFVIPGTTKKIKVTTKENKSTGIYFLFTTPSEDWKEIVNNNDSHKVKVLLGENEIKSINVFGS